MSNGNKKTPQPGLESASPITSLAVVREQSSDHAPMSFPEYNAETATQVTDAVPPQHVVDTGAKRNSEVFHDASIDVHMDTGDARPAWVLNAIPSTYAAEPFSDQPQEQPESATVEQHRTDNNHIALQSRQDTSSGDSSGIPSDPSLSFVQRENQDNIVFMTPPDPLGSPTIGSPSNTPSQGGSIDDAFAMPTQLPGVTTQVAPVIVPDTESSDEAYAESTTTSYLTSIKSEISRGVLENERLYPSYGQHKYGMPIDDDELDRMDLQHRKYELVIGDKHFLAPIGPTPHRILDLGTGTGIWALDVADMYPSAQVIGVDIAPIQPKWVAANCQFEIDDIEETWTFKKNSFDFIHFRDPLYSIRNWPKLMAQCYEHLKPGGWCELACIYPVPMCDDGTMPPDSAFKVICDKFMEAAVLFGTPADSPLYFGQYLRNAGFVDVAEHIFKVPSSPWPKDQRLKQIGALEMTNVVEGSTAFGLRAFGQVFGWSKDRTELAMVNFRRDVKNRHYHQYCQYFVVYGRRAPVSSTH